MMCSIIKLMSTIPHTGSSKDTTPCVRVVQWNIRINSDACAISERLREATQFPAIVHLQEVSQSAVALISKQLEPDSCAFSLIHRPPGKNEGRNRRMGVATLTFRGKIVNAVLVDRAVFPERTLVTEVEIAGSRVRSLNFHSLTGVDYKKAKSSNFASIADYLESCDIDFLCCDANEPKTDSMCEADVEYFDNRDKGSCAAMVFGAGSRHGLLDSYKTHLRNTGAEVNKSPLATSHLVAGHPRRYDHIFHAPRWHVMAMSYDYDSAVCASSDHAIVVADFCRT